MAAGHGGEPPLLICNGELEVVKITPDLYDEAVELYRNHFMKHENVTKALGLDDTEDSVAEMLALFHSVLIDGISFGARDRKTGHLAAFCINKLLCPETQNSVSEACTDVKSPNMIALAEYLERMELSFNILKEWNIDCAMEILFLATRKEYSGRRLATLLAEHSVAFARQMFEGNLPGKVKNSLPAHVRDLRPKAVCSVLTSLFSQKVGRNIGLIELVKIPFTEFSFNGKTLNEYIDPIHVYSIYAAMKL